MKEKAGTMKGYQPSSNKDLTFPGEVFVPRKNRSLL